jgi:nitrite reductase/ring-hydroxylating ferredoxin subunit/uncharacterized membrane protein
VLLARVRRMRTKAYLYGHPAHPMLIPFPLAFLAGAFGFDVVGRYLSNTSLSTTAAHLTIAGIAAGLLAAVPGVIDYINSVPPKSSGKKRATKHAMANSAALALFLASWLGRDSDMASLGTLTLQFVGLVMLGMGGWMGGTLVYRNQIGVDHRYAGAGKWRESIHNRVDSPVVVADSDQLKVNQMVLVHLDAQRVAVGRSEEGCHAFDDRCTHKGGPLSDGVMICGTVQCPWHGSQFDVATGNVKAGPARKKIDTHRVQESNGQIRVG